MTVQDIQDLVEAAFVMGVAAGEKGAVAFTREDDPKWEDYQQAMDAIEVMFAIETFAGAVWEIDQ